MPVKILVADDSATMRQIMQMTFAGEDAEVVTVDSGDAAVQKAKEMQPDVVFADASMAKDGYAVAQEIKGAGVNAAVIVLASQHNPFDENRGKEAGVDDHVLKPFDTQVVIDKTQAVLGRPRAAASAAAPKPPPPAPPSKQTAAGAGGPPPPPPPRPTASSGPAQPARPAQKSTVAFGAPNRPAAGPPSAPAASAKADKPVLELADEEPPKPKSAPPPAASKPAAAVAAATGNGGDMAAKLRELGLDENQVNGVLSLSREVIEQVVWEVVPDLAETIIREEIRRLTAE